MEQKNSKTLMVSSTVTEGALTSDIILLRKVLHNPSQVNYRPLKQLANRDVQGSPLTQANSPASLRPLTKEVSIGAPAVTCGSLVSRG